MAFTRNSLEFRPDTYSFLFSDLPPVAPRGLTGFEKTPSCKPACKPLHIPWKTRYVFGYQEVTSFHGTICVAQWASRIVFIIMGISDIRRLRRRPRAVARAPRDVIALRRERDDPPNSPLRPSAAPVLICLPPKLRRPVVAEIDDFAPNQRYI